MDLEPLDPSFVVERLSKPPFVIVDGVYNVRDLGLSSVMNDTSIATAEVVSPPMRPGFIYRSGEVSAITEQGKTQLRDMGVKKIFDMRSDPEIHKWNTPLPHIHGVHIIRAPVFKDEDYSPEAMAKRFQLYSSGKTEAFMQLYTDLLHHGGPSFGTIMRHIRDKTDEPMLFHCTGETGVLAALLLRLVDASDEVIARDYALTRIGREPCRAKVMTRLAKEPIFAQNNEAALNMFTCRHDTMVAFLQLLRDKYGDAENYCRTHLSLTTEDIARIRHNLKNAPRS